VYYTRLIPNFFWVVTTCSVVIGYLCFRGTMFLPPSGWRWRQQSNKKTPQTFDSVTTQRNSNLHRRENLKSRIIQNPWNKSLCYCYQQWN